jgi:hypothetical protein
MKRCNENVKQTVGYAPDDPAPAKLASAVEFTLFNSPKNIPLLEKKLKL